MVGIGIAGCYRPFEARGKIILRRRKEIRISHGTGGFIALRRGYGKCRSHGLRRSIAGLEEHISRRLFHYFTAAPATIRTLLISAQPITRHIHESSVVPLSQPRAFWLYGHPDDIAHLSQYVIGMTGYAEVIHDITFHLLLAVAPHTVQGAQRSAICNIFLHPGGGHINGILAAGS